MGTFTKPSEEFYRVPAVQEHIDLAAEFVGRDRRNNFHDEMHYRIAASDGFSEGQLQFDSPLEVIFWLWWRAQTDCNPLLEMNFRIIRHQFIKAGEDTFNVDFVVAKVVGEVVTPLVIVELDGHTFHEKTLEQVTYRNRRDRALQQAGWRIFHFSWDEFTRSPAERIAELANHAMSMGRANRAVEPGA